MGEIFLDTLHIAAKLTDISRFSTKAGLAKIMILKNAKNLIFFYFNQIFPLACNTREQLLVDDAINDKD